MDHTPTTALLDRREFTVQTVLAMLSGVAIVISEGCGSSNPAGPSGGGGTPTDVNGTVSANHGHTATIRAATLISPTTIALDIQGTATHTHTVNLTQADVTSIAARTQVTSTSTTDSFHNHVVTFN
jgi:hypothetical protein